MTCRPLLTAPLALLLGACSTASLHQDFAQTRAQDRAAAQALTASAPSEPRARADWLHTQRQRISANRAQAQASYTQAEAQCWQRFAVNHCLQQARQQRRRTLDQLLQNELALNQLERQAQYGPATQRQTTPAAATPAPDSPR